ncbi:MAG: hypothetical protein J5829_07625 [Lachnospiraceae bacterium]|nr:hypothetical protein [Lachnospiraceae bacterium]
MTFVLIACLSLYLFDKKAVRIIQACLLPAFIVLPALFRLKTTEGYAFYAGLIIFGAAPFAELLCRKLAPIFERAVRVPDQERSEDGEDVLDNKKKWGLIKAGFIASLIAILMLLAAVLTLNSKVNNMYRFTTEQQSTIQEQQKEIDELKEEAGKK